jgi:hypothetical protein
MPALTTHWKADRRLALTGVDQETGHRRVVEELDPAAIDLYCEAGDWVPLEVVALFGIKPLPPVEEPDAPAAAATKVEPEF